MSFEEDDNVLEYFEEGQTVYFRPKLYQYRIWVQGKIVGFVTTISGIDSALIRPNGPGFGPTNSKNTFFTMDVQDLYSEKVKEDDPRAPKGNEYTTRRKKGRRRKK